jgi:hypothetical protein
VESQTPQLSARDLAIVERFHPAADRLRRFVPLSGDHDRIARTGFLESDPNRFGAVHEERGSRRGAGNRQHPRLHVAEDLLGVLVSRIVRGDDDAVGSGCDSSPHAEPLSAVTIAAASKHHEQAAGG